MGLALRLVLLVLLAESLALLGARPHTRWEQLKSRLAPLLLTESSGSASSGNSTTFFFPPPSSPEVTSVLLRWERASPIVVPAVRGALRGLVLAFSRFSRADLLAFGGQRGEEEMRVKIALPEGRFAEARVSVDGLGRATIVSDTQRDGYTAQGYLHAAERLWQMEAARRLARGTLSEVLGGKALVADRFSRTMGFARAGERDMAWLAEKEAEALDVLQAYADGVNAYVLGGGSMPVEFKLLGLEWEEWTPVDTMRFSHLLSWMMTKGHDAEMVRAELHRVVGADRAHALDVIHIGDGLLREGILHAHHSAHAITKAAKDALAALWVDDATIEDDWRTTVAQDTDADLFASTLASAVAGGVGGSNAWVISGEHTESGKPLLSSDPHLPLSQPSIWYQVRLTTAGQADTISGFSIAGAPGVMIGATSKTAWGITLSRADVEDLFVEHIEFDGGKNCSLFCDGTGGDCSAANLCSSCKYEFEGEWRECAVRHERVQVKGQETRATVVVVKTHHGPVLPRAIIGYGQNNIALRSTVLTEPPSLMGFIRFRSAQNAPELMRAARSIRSPPLNIVFGTADGDIGHVLTGAHPVRGARATATKDDSNAESGKDADDAPLGILPAPGWTGTHEWLGYLPSAELPHALNPKEGYVVTANNHIGQPGTHAWIGGSFQSGWRARRLTELIQAEIEAKRPVEVATCAKWQADTVSIAAVEIMAVINGSFGDESRLSDDERGALACLSDWDGDMSADSCAATVYTSLKEFVFRFILESVFLKHGGLERVDAVELSQVVRGRATKVVLKPSNDLLGMDAAALVFALRAAKKVEANSDGVSEHERDAAWWVHQAGSVEEVLRESLRAAVDELRVTYGPLAVPRDWIWGEVHYQDFLHSLGRARPLDWLFNQGPVPRGGDIDTPNMASLLPHTGFRATGWGPSMRSITDFGRASAVPGMPRQYTVMPPGQSGASHSAHYGDQTEAFLEGDLFDVDRGTASGFSAAARRAAAAKEEQEAQAPRR